MGFLNGLSGMGRFFIVSALVLVAVGLALGGDARAVFLTIGLSLVITGFVFKLVGARLGVVSSLDKALRDRGVEGTALVASLGETGVTVNSWPVLEFGLRVDSPAHPEYETTIHQRTPRILVGAVLPGSTVPVVVDPANREHLAIDWDAWSAAPPEADMDRDVVSPRTQRVDAQQLLRTGRHAAAVITAMEDAGDMSELGLVEVGEPGDDDRLMIIGLEVKQPGLEPYDVRVAHRVPERLLGRVGPRTTVDVAVDRDDDQSVAIDWTSVG